MKRALFFTKKKGFTTIEILFAFSLLSAIIVGIISATIAATSTISDSNEASFASLLAEEAFEVIHNIRNDDFSALTDGTYGLTVNTSSEWELASLPDSTDGFTRTIEIQTVDANTVQVDVSIDWNVEVGGNKTIDFVRYYKNIYRSTVVAGDWSSPFISSNNNLPGNNDGVRIIIENDLMYFARNGGNPDILVFDISDPTNLVQLGSVNVNGNPNDITKIGTSLFIASTGQEVISVDVSNPASLSVLDQENLQGGDDVLSIVSFGNNILATRSQSGNREEVYIFNVANPSNINQIYSANFSDNINSSVYFDNTVYLATDSNAQEVIFYDVTNPASANISGAINLSGNADAISIELNEADEVLYIGRENGSIELYDISNPGSPVFLSEYTSNGVPNSLEYVASLDYLFAGYVGATQNFQVIDVSNASNPLPYGGVNNFNGNRGIAFDSIRGIVYGANSNNGNELVIYEPN